MYAPMHYLNFCAAGLGTLQDATEPERDAAQAGTEHEGAHFQASHCPPRDRRQGTTNPRAPGIPDGSPIGSDICHYNAN